MLSVTKNFFSNATAATTHNVPFPADIESGDLLLLFLSFDGNPTITLPAGWNIHAQANPSNKGAFATKRANGTESGTFAVDISASEPCAATIYRAQGSVNVPQMVFESANFSGNPVATPAINLNWDPVEAIFFSSITGFSTGSTTISSYPIGYTDTEYQSTGAGTGHTAIATAYKIASLDSETPGNFALSGSTSGIGFTVAVVEFAIQSVTPDGLPINKVGSTIIRVAGVLESGAEVHFGPEESPSVLIPDNQTIIAVIPVSEVVEDVDLRVVNPVENIEVEIEDGFSYLFDSPRITELTPAGAGLNEVTNFTIHGINFESGATVTIDDIACTNVVFVDSETITADCPIGTEQKLAILIVENPDGQQALGNFYYMDVVPTISAKTPVRAKFTIENVPYVA